MASTQTTRRRTSSLTVSRAMTIMAPPPPTRPAAPGSAPRASRVRAPRRGPDRRPRPARRRGPGSDRLRAGGPTASRRRASTGPNAGSGRPTRLAKVGHAQAHPVGGDDLVERPGRDDPAVVEDDHAIADPLDLGQQVGVEDDRRAAVAGRAHDRPHVGPTDRIERRRRLVEEDQVRVAEERDAEPEPLLHALRERADRVVGAVDQPDQGEGVVDGLWRARRRGSGPARRGGSAPRGHGATAGSGTARAGSRSAARARRSPSGAPRTWPEPALGRTRPSSSLMVVVLPAPFGPSRPTSSPRPTVRLRSVEGGASARTTWRRRSRSIAGVDTLAVTGGRHGSGHRSQRRRDGEVRDVRHRMPMVRRSGNGRGRRARRVRVRRVRHPRRGRGGPGQRPARPRRLSPSLGNQGGVADRRDRGEEQADGRDRDAHQRHRDRPAGQVDQRATDEQADRLKPE